MSRFIVRVDGLPVSGARFDGSVAVRLWFGVEDDAEPFEWEYSEAQRIKAGFPRADLAEVD